MRYCKQVNHAPPTMPTATAARHPFSAADWASLKRLAKIIHKWNEDECNGIIQYDDDGITPRRYHNDRYGCPCVPGSAVPDKSEAAVENARKIAAKHGLSIYHQSDPRGCSLYVYNAHDLKGRKIDECYSVLARPVI